MDFLKWWDKVPQTHLYDDCGNDISWIFNAIRSGYYVPSVEQTAPDQMSITFTPAGEWLGNPIVATVKLLPGERGLRGPEGPQGPKGDPGNVLAISKAIVGTGAAIKTQLLAQFTEMANNTIIGIYVSNSDQELGGKAYTGTLSKVGSIGSVVLNGIDADYSVRANIYNGTVTDWRWSNPPMDVGIEYMTNENWSGKAVYTQLVDCGVARNNAFITVAEIAACVRYVGYLSYPNESAPRKQLPIWSEDTVGTGYHAEITQSTTAYDAGKFIIKTDSNNDGFGSGGYRWYVRVWYTKDYGF